MVLRSDAKRLRHKAVRALIACVRAYNDPDDDDRLTTVLLRAEHAFEMLLKAALVQRGKVAVMDKSSGRSISLDKAINYACGDTSIKLDAAEAGLIRVISELRDAEQHWFIDIDEGALYIHIRGAVTLFDDLLHRLWQERLADHMTQRVMPIGSEAPQDFQLLVDSSFDNVKELLRPGRRSGSNARARVAALLAMRRHSDADYVVTEREITKAISDIKSGKSREDVLPGLGAVGTDSSGEGFDVQLRFVKKGGLPVTYVKDGDLAEVAGIREVNMLLKYHLSASNLAAELNLTQPKALALRRHLGVDDDPSTAAVVFTLGDKPIVQYSDNATRKMREALTWVDMGNIWASHGTARKGTPKPRCVQPGCTAERAAEELPVIGVHPLAVANA